LHLLTFDHPQNQSNLVCLTLVFLDLFLFFILCALFIANPNRRWTATSPTNPKILWMIQKTLQARRCEAQAKKLDFVDSKAEDEGSFESSKVSPPQSSRESRLPLMGEQP
jgi:hypothetical protein